MGDMVWVQCQVCGELHKVESEYASISDDDLYITEIWCPRCRDVTKHLNCGEDETDIYFYYNVILDPRYY